MSFKLAEPIFTQEALKVFEPKVYSLVVFVHPRAAEQDFFFVLCFLRGRTELIQILIKLPVDAGVLTDLHDCAVSFGHLFHQLIDTGFPAAPGHGLGHEVKLLYAGFLEHGLAL